MEDSSRASFIQNITDIFQYLDTRTEKLVNDSGDPFDYGNLSYEEKAIVILSRMTPIMIFQNERDKIISKSAKINSKIKAKQNLVNDNYQTPSNFERDKQKQTKDTNLDKGISVDNLFDQISLIVDEKKKQNQTLKNITQTQIQRLYSLRSAVDQLSPSEKEELLQYVFSLQQKAKMVLNQSIQAKTEIFSLEIENKNLKNQITSYLNNQKKRTNSVSNTNINQSNCTNQNTEFSMNLRDQQAKINKTRSIIEKLQQENQLLEMKIDSYEKRINTMKISTYSHLSLVQRALMNIPNKKQGLENAKSDSLSISKSKMNDYDTNDTNENYGYDDTESNKVSQFKAKKVRKKRKCRNKKSDDKNSKVNIKEKSAIQPLLNDFEEEEENNRNDNNENGFNRQPSNNNETQNEIENSNISQKVGYRSFEDIINRQPSENFDTKKTEKEDVSQKNEIRSFEDIKNRQQQADCNKQKEEIKIEEEEEVEEEEKQETPIRSFEDIKNRSALQHAQNESDHEGSEIRSFEDLMRRSNRKSSLTQIHHDEGQISYEGSDSVTFNGEQCMLGSNSNSGSGSGSRGDDEEIQQTIETATSSVGCDSPVFVPDSSGHSLVSQSFSAKKKSQRRRRQLSESESDEREFNVTQDESPKNNEQTVGGYDIKDCPNLLQTDDSKSGNDGQSSNEEETANQNHNTTSTFIPPANEKKNSQRRKRQGSDSETESLKQEFDLNQPKTVILQNTSANVQSSDSSDPNQVQPSNASERPSSLPSQNTTTTNNNDNDNEDEVHSHPADSSSRSSSQPQIERLSSHKVRMPESRDSSSSSPHSARSRSVSDTEKQKSDSREGSDEIKSNETINLPSKSGDDLNENNSEKPCGSSGSAIQNPFLQPPRKFILQGQRNYRKPQPIVRLSGRIINKNQPQKPPEQPQPESPSPGQATKDAAMEVIEIIQKFKAMLRGEENDEGENSPFTQYGENDEGENSPFTQYGENEEGENSPFTQYGENEEGENEEGENEEGENSPLHQFDENDEGENSPLHQFGENSPFNQFDENKNGEKSQFDEIEEEEEQIDDYTAPEHDE